MDWGGKLENILGNDLTAPSESRANVAGTLNAWTLKRLAVGLTEEVFPSANHL
jgi:hypothetical protein